MGSLINQRDLNGLFELDKVFFAIYTQYGSPPDWRRPEGFVSLSRIILEQQLSLASARAHFQKLNDYLPSFTPLELLKLTDQEMRTCQISRQKTRYLRELSTAVIHKTIDLDVLSTLPSEEVRQILTTIPGIGNWTVDIYQIFCLQEKDIFPKGDITLVKTVMELWSANTKEEVIMLSEKWRPYRALASFFLWYYYLKKRNRKAEIS